MSFFRHPILMGDVGYDRLDEEEEKEISERLRKTLYYGKYPTTDKPSLPLTDFAVEFLCNAAPRKLGKLDHYVASSTSRQNCMSPCSIMMGMIYVRRLRQRNPEYLQQISSSDLFLISMMMASKFLYDEGTDDEVFNDEWANSVDLESEEINQMERQFLSAIDWQLYVRRKDFEAMLYEVEKRIALQKGSERDWFSYTDLWVLSLDPQFQLLWRQVSKEVSKVLVVMAVTYIAGILTMVGSTMLVMSAGSAVSGLHPLVPPFVRPVPTPALQSSTNKSEQESHGLTKQDSKSAPESKRLPPPSSILSQLWTLLTIPSILSVQCSGVRPKDTNSQALELTADSPSLTGNTRKMEVHSGADEMETRSSFQLQVSLVTFIYAVKDKFLQSSTWDQEFAKVSQDSVCGNRPCLPGYRNCKNVSADPDPIKSNFMKLSNCNRCSKASGSISSFSDRLRPVEYDSCLRNLVPLDESSGIPTSGDRESYQTVNKQKCCCHSLRYTGSEIDRGPLLDHFSDVSVGFHTGFHLLKT